MGCKCKHNPHAVIVDIYANVSSSLWCMIVFSFSASISCVLFPYPALVFCEVHVLLWKDFIRLCSFHLIIYLSVFDMPISFTPQNKGILCLWRLPPTLTRSTESLSNTQPQRCRLSGFFSSTCWRRSTVTATGEIFSDCQLFVKETLSGRHFLAGDVVQVSVLGKAVLVLSPVQPNS